MTLSSEQAEMVHSSSKKDPELSTGSERTEYDWLQLDNGLAQAVKVLGS